MLENPSDPPQLRVGVFDSGVGGLSVLQALRAHLPEAELLYVADSGHAPYGERGEAYVTDRSVAITDFLLTQAAQMVVIACNTATAVASSTLRHQHPGLPIVGVEPGVKPAVKASPTGRIGVMATTGTLHSDKFQRLVQAHQGEASIHLQACPGLAHAIEHGRLDSPEVRSLVRQFTAPLQKARVDTVVLGCTHYPFVAALIQQALGPHVQLIDTADAVARWAAQLAHTMAPTASTVHHAARTPVWTSGDPQHLTTLASHWLTFPVQVHKLPVLGGRSMPNT